MQIVCDTSSLIKLRKADALDILSRLFEKVHVADAVRKECEDREPDIIRCLQTGTFVVSFVPHPLDIGLGCGERETISLAVALNITWVLTDDEQAMKKARQQGRRVLQFFDILLAGKKRGHIDSVRDRLERMRSMGEGIERHLYLDILRRANEEIPDDISS